MLLNKYGLMRSNWIYDGFGEALKDARIIFRKILLACAAENLPLGLDDNVHKNIWENVTKNLKIKDGDSLAKELEIISTIDDIEVRRTKTEKLLNNCF